MWLERMSAAKKVHAWGRRGIAAMMENEKCKMQNDEC
jgi:hypothetical protein